VRERITIRKILIAALPAALLTIGAASASEYGSPAEARAMLERAIAAVKQDKSAALAMFTTGAGGFKDRDLYPYCGGTDGKFTAHPSLVGKSLVDLKDKAGKPFRAEIYAVADEAIMRQVSYVWPRPGENEPVQKAAYVQKIGDQICAVGYYEK